MLAAVELLAYTIARNLYHSPEVIRGTAVAFPPHVRAANGGEASVKAQRSDNEITQ
jgi:hypothetical protein